MLCYMVKGLYSYEKHLTNTFFTIYPVKILNGCYEIQEKWKIGICVAEKSASISVIACFNVQRSYNYEISSHPLISASAFYEESKIVTFEDKSKESESGQKSEITSINKFKDSEKDSQKVEVTFKDEFKGSKKDDQATFEDGSEGLEKNDHNNQSPFISIDWHEWLERILEVISD
ncbi:hypothetical protein RhiirA5_412492 [Rhizophagus irregularis]|uniref:Uncharacterized protein n=1 Tax=Rhizophagus irregularis TaxID=588596 RepID=A0A2I1E9K0_9GLOM|nr:hypothetical protein RhiirA5_412492 [Rhizophagus irregularis]PKY18814.1 hypothetical protein RhiirB3_431706 [Rhizophagus irregularis]